MLHISIILFSNIILIMSIPMRNISSTLKPCKLRDISIPIHGTRILHMLRMVIHLTSILLISCKMRYIRIMHSSCIYLLSNGRN